MAKEQTPTTGLIRVPKELKDSLIQEHGKENLRILELPKDDLETSALEVIVKVPNRTVMSQFMRFIDNNPKKAQEILISNCLLTSKEEVNADDALFMAAVGGIGELFPIRQARVKNL